MIIPPKLGRKDELTDLMPVGTYWRTLWFLPDTDRVVDGLIRITARRRIRGISDNVWLVQVSEEEVKALAMIYDLTGQVETPTEEELKELLEAQT